MSAAAANKSWPGVQEREYARGFTDACEPMPCGHPRACRENAAQKCTSCAREGKIGREIIQSEIFAAEKKRLIKIAIAACETALPKQTIDFIDGVRAGADAAKEALERA